MITKQRGAPARAVADDAGRWQAVARRDGAEDGVFVYAVRTTGVYCRPSCAARLPNRKNVRFFATGKEAAREGFRPCKRCRPDDAPRAARQRDAVARACRLLEEHDAPSSLADLASSVGMSSFHFHRVFKLLTGVTPKAYANAQRARRVRDELARGATVTAAIYGAGFNSNGRFYESAAATLGMKPSEFRAGGDKAAIQFATGRCSLGSILVAASAKGVCAIFLGDEPDALARDLQKRFPKARIGGGDAAFRRWLARAVELVDQPERALDLPLDIRGTAFQVRVWQALRKIPIGTTATYAEIAARIGQPTAARAVARACAANPLAVAIPCHRIVRRDARRAARQATRRAVPSAAAVKHALSGYRWGVERKAELLKREREARAQILRES